MSFLVLKMKNADSWTTYTVFLSMEMFLALCSLVLLTHDVFEASVYSMETM
jgi:hypothetical protein